MTIGGRGASRRGQALTEAVVVMPLLVLLIMGAVDVGRLLFASVALEEAAQEGALFAAYNPADDGPIEARVLASSTAEEVQDATVTVDCVATPAPGTVEVTVEVDYPLITPVVSALLGSPVTLSATVVATNVQGTCS
jgi:Flp pilus assembly protein TadG